VEELGRKEGVSIRTTCQVLGYSKQAYYKSKKVQQHRQEEAEAIRQQVKYIRRHMPRIGTRKLHYLLKEHMHQTGIYIGRDRLFDVLRAGHLLIKRKRRYACTTDSRHNMRKYPNLIKHLSVEHPEQVWVADITYLTLKGGFNYLHLITDAYSKQIMGYCLSDTLSTEHTLKALDMAMHKRCYTHALIHHSDRGTQYCSAMYTEGLKQKTISISMTRGGNPYDNAIAERVNGILKDEYGLHETFTDRSQLERHVQQAIYSYNHQRPHLSNYMLTPNEMHQQNQLTPKTWNKKTTRTLQSSCGFLPSPNIT